MLLLEYLQLWNKALGLQDSQHAKTNKQVNKQSGTGKGNAVKQTKLILGRGEQNLSALWELKK